MYVIYFTTALNSSLIFDFRFSSLAEGIPMDHPHLVFLFFMCQLFLRELAKCSRLVQLIPMDMSGYFGRKLDNYYLHTFNSFTDFCITTKIDSTLKYVTESEWSDVSKNCNRERILKRYIMLDLCISVLSFVYFMFHLFRIMRKSFEKKGYFLFRFSNQK